MRLVRSATASAVNCTSAAKTSSSSSSAPARMLCGLGLTGRFGGTNDDARMALVGEACSSSCSCSSSSSCSQARSRLSSPANTHSGTTSVDNARPSSSDGSVGPTPLALGTGGAEYGKLLCGVCGGMRSARPLDAGLVVATASSTSSIRSGGLSTSSGGTSALSRATQAERSNEEVDEGEREREGMLGRGCGCCAGGRGSVDERGEKKSTVAGAFAGAGAGHGGVVALDGLEAPPRYECEDSWMSCECVSPMVGSPPPPDASRADVAGSRCVSLSSIGSVSSRGTRRKSPYVDTRRMSLLPPGAPLPSSSPTGCGVATLATSAPVRSLAGRASPSSAGSPPSQPAESRSSSTAAAASTVRDFFALGPTTKRKLDWRFLAERDADAPVVSVALTFPSESRPCSAKSAAGVGARWCRGSRRRCTRDGRVNHRRERSKQKAHTVRQARPHRPPRPPSQSAAWASSPASLSPPSWPSAA
ncbi:hypothetical protein DMC30DRAFT_271385 [Rhodotorula diobovata]|uniref:Uncharacterized protein n=1 Tax=Rhodotorula diobovata TaxID=5288 RepID=A0A5C5FTD0_9BASI|nr:hypothetical protein DMC30DRAFT_271385 [Rhodotorula diobovata]